MARNELFERPSGLSENPLLPHNKLRELHALMLRCRALERANKHKGVLREALLAATAIHLQAGDLVSTPPGDHCIANLARANPARSSERQAFTSLLTPSIAVRASDHPRLLLGAAAARGIQTGDHQGVVLSFCREGSPEPGWRQALEWACNSRLPLLTVCIDGSARASAARSRRKQPALTYAALATLARRWRLPVLTVDGEDAVAVYRVMQESVLRARMGDGPAVIWAAMTPRAALSRMPPSAQPMARLRRYMAVRKIALRP
jgi:pyruvate dehydrogenase E1 component alpha subunit